MFGGGLGDLSINPLLSWFERRHKSKTLSLAQRQVSKSLETATQLESAFISARRGEEEEARRWIEKLFETEREVDDLRREVLKELSTSNIEWRYREDLMLLIRRLDVFADWVKDSARSTSVVLGADMPDELADSYISIGGLIKQCTTFLSGSMEMMGINIPQSMELALKVYDVENQIDKEYLRTRALFIKYGNDVNPGVLMILRDILEYLERAADVCADTADYLGVIAAGE